MRAQTADRIATGFFYAGAGVVVLILAGLIGYILYHGASSIDWAFITSPPGGLAAGGGIGPQIFNSFYLLFLTMFITIPIGLLAGIYLAEFAKPGKVTEAIRLSIETLTSLPSIVVGLFGLLIFVNYTGWGYTLMSGALALTVINLPMMVRISEEAIRNVPMELREGSLALGATQWQTICKVVLPSAFLSIMTGIIITSGRVFGEAAALLFTAGMSSPPLNFTNLDITSPASPWNPFRPAETLAVHIWKVNSESLIPDVRRVADGSAAILILVVLFFNISARWLGRRIHNKLTGQ
ncbi:phosphate ABC transporter permease PstA [Desulfotomaculum sp. 1211_IL3151]|uniref:phosphate ABC transporter permease PstA n=1 Tax=Desulfotomaculum sp. 1211_IL3151 TaxID=3084055 RepID=UPI002FDB1657